MRGLARCSSRHKHLTPVGVGLLCFWQQQEAGDLQHDHRTLTTRIAVGLPFTESAPCSFAPRRHVAVKAIAGKSRLAPGTTRNRRHAEAMLASLLSCERLFVRADMLPQEAQFLTPRHPV